MKLVPLFLIIPLASAFLIPLVNKKMKNACDIIGCVSTFFLAVISFSIAISTIGCRTIVYRTFGHAGAAGVFLTVDSLSGLMLVVMNIVAFAVAVYSTGYTKKYTDRWKFFTLFMLMVTGINGVLISGDIFNLYLFMEIAAISGYFLVAFGIDGESLEAAFKYAVMGIVASAFILLGIAFLYSYTSTLNMADMAKALALNPSSKVILFASVLFLMGFGLKAALVPFHAWLAYAHSSAPAPVSSMLSGVSIKVLGVYALARIFFNVFGMNSAISSILIVLAVLSMFLGAFLAFGQSDIKRLFAYSSVSQIGYIALGLGVGTPLAIFGALFYLVNHSIFKSLLFLNSGAIEQVTGTRDLGKMSAVIKKSPVTGYTSLIAALSICGIPPLGGFWSKLIIIIACIQANRPGLALAAAIVSILTLGYYFKSLSPALFGTESQISIADNTKRVPLTMELAMVFLAALTIFIAFSLLPNQANSLLKDAASVLTTGILK